MKVTLLPTQFVYNPSTKTINFDNMVGSFSPERLLAVTNVTTGKLIYAVASADAGYGGTFSNGIYTNSVLTYTSSNAGQLVSDIIEVLYDDLYYSQSVAGSVNALAHDYQGNPIEGVIDPITSKYKLKTASSIYAGDGTPILSSVDPISGGDGLNVHLQSSAYGGELGQPLPSAAFGYQGALSMGFLNGSVLVAPKMDPVTNELIVQANFAAAATQNVNITEVAGNTIGGPNLPIDIVSQSGGNIQTNINIAGVTPDSNLGATSGSTLRTSSNLALNGTAASASLGANDAGTLRTASNIGFNGVAAATQNGVVTTGTQRVVLATDQPAVATNITNVGGGALTFGLKASTSSIPIVVSSDNATGTIAVLNGSVTNTVTGYGACAIDIRGTFTATLAFQGSIDGTNWTLLQATPIGSAQNVALVTSASAAGSWLVNCAGCTRVRVYATAYTSGTATVNLVATNSSGWVYSAPIGATNSVAIASGTVTTVSTVTTCSTVASVTQSGTALPVQVVDVASALISVTTTSGPFTPTNGVANSILLIVSAVTGTNPTMDVSIEMSDDGGTSWFKVYDYPRITAAGTYRSAPLKLLGNRIRYVQTLGGTSPNFTRSFTRLQRSDTIYSRFVSRDRTINPNTLNSTSAAFYCEGSTGFNFYTRISAQTTPATIQIQFSDDATNWYDDLSNTITTATGIVQAKADNDQWRYARAIVSAAGSGITLEEFVIKAIRE